jgi:hypothetical protein
VTVPAWVTQASSVTPSAAAKVLCFIAEFPRC